MPWIQNQQAQLRGLSLDKMNCRFLWRGSVTFEQIAFTYFTGNYYIGHSCLNVKSILSIWVEVKFSVLRFFSNQQMKELLMCYNFHFCSKYLFINPILVEKNKLLLLKSRSKFFLSGSSCQSKKAPCIHCYMPIKRNAKLIS